MSQMIVLIRSLQPKFHVAESDGMHSYAVATKVTHDKNGSMHMQFANKVPHDKNDS